MFYRICMFVFVKLYLSLYHLLITADSECPLAVKHVWISVCVVHACLFRAPSVCSREEKSLNMTGHEGTQPWQRTHTVWRGQTHMYITNKHAHTTSASVGIRVCPVSVSVCVCDSRRHICVSLITERAFVSAVSQEHTHTVLTVEEYSPSYGW